MDTLVAILLSLLFLAIGIAAVWIAKAKFDIQNNAAFVALIIMPAILYAVFSGQLQEVTTGEFAIKFQRAARQSVTGRKIAVNAHVKAALAKNEKSEEEFQKTIEILGGQNIEILTFQWGKSYDAGVASENIKSLRSRSACKHVIIWDGDQKFGAYMPFQEIFFLALEGPKALQPFLSLITAGKQGALKELQQYRGVVTETISADATNIGALKRMNQLGVQAIVVVDDDNTTLGVVEREAVVSELLLGTAK